MGQRAAGKIKRCAAVAGPTTDLPWSSKKPGYGGYLVTGAYIQHFRAFPAAVGVTRAPG